MKSGMPVTWWQYGLYGLMEITPPHWFGRWSIMLMVCIAVWIRLFFHRDSNNGVEFITDTTSQDWYKQFEASSNVKQLTTVLLRWSGFYDSSVPLGVTILGLRNHSDRTEHTEFLTRLEHTLYDPNYQMPLSLETMKNYLLDHKFFESLTRHD